MPRKTILTILITQEVGLIVISLAWLFFRNLNSFFQNGITVLAALEPLKGMSVTFSSIFYGLAAGIFLLLLSFIITLSYEPFKESLKKIDSFLLSKVKKSDFLLIALLSGIGEELFFRGVLQNEIGLIWTSIIFAVLHIPGKDLWVYGLWAFFASMYLGNIYAYTNNLFIVIVAHTLNNLLALLIWQKFRNKIIGTEVTDKE